MKFSTKRPESLAQTAAQQRVAADVAPLRSAAQVKRQPLGGLTAEFFNDLVDCQTSILG
ncbi:MAG: hypothetical protein QME21_04575 [Anaerolineales bacterium]|nr:hypothetical protein [Anaerolineales bacterium]